MRNFVSDWPRLTTTTVAALQSLALLGLAINIALLGLTSGLEGPESVSSPTGAAVEVIAFGLFAAGMAAIAMGRWRSSSWSGPPFLLAQLLALTVGIPLATASDSVGTTLGVLITGSAIAGLISLVAGALRTPDVVDLRKPQEVHEHAVDS